MKTLLQALGRFVCCLMSTTLLLLSSAMQPAFAFDCPKGGTCPSQCDDFAQVMEERTPFYYPGDFGDVCVSTLNQEGIRVREEGTGAASVYILTTTKPFSFRSEWVGRRGRNRDSWYFEQYKA